MKHIKKIIHTSLAIVFLTSIQAMDVDSPDDITDEQTSPKCCHLSLCDLVAGVTMETTGCAIAAIPSFIVYFADQSKEASLKVAIGESAYTSALLLLYLLPDPLNYMPQMIGVAGSAVLADMRFKPCSANLDTALSVVRINQYVAFVLYGAGTIFSWLHYAYFDHENSNHFHFANLITTFTAALLYAALSSPISLRLMKSYKSR